MRGGDGHLCSRRTEANGIDVRRNVGGHGVVGLIKGKGNGKTIAIRADMDALPLQDAKETDYASEVGRGHALVRSRCPYGDPSRCGDRYLQAERRSLTGV